MAGQDIALTLMISAQDTASSVISKIAGPIGLIAAALVGVGVEAVKMAGNFQQGLTVLSTGAGEAQKNLQMVGDGIKQISIDTATSTDQLLKGMFMVESAGYHGAAGLTVLKVAAEGAKLENSDLGQTAFALTGILHDYSMNSSQAAAAMNALITTESSGKMHMQDLTNSLGAVLPIAAALGVSFPQIGGAIAVMTNANMTARNAAQNLSFALRALAAPSGIAVKAMAEVGLTAQQVKDALSQQGLAAALQLIEDHVGRTFPANSVQSVTAFKALLGGATGYKVALMLSGPHMQEYENNIKNITTAMNNGKAGVDGWAQVQDNFNFKMGQLHSAIDVLLIDFGTGLLPALSLIATGLTIVVGGFAGWLTNAQGLPAVMDQLGIALSPVAKLFGLVQQSLPSVVHLFQQVGEAIADIFRPVQQIAQAIAKVTDNTKPMLDSFNRAPGVFAALTKAGNPMVDTFNRARDVLSQVAKIAKPAMDVFGLTPAPVTSPAHKALQDAFDRTKGVFSGPAAVPVDTFNRATSVIKATTVAAAPFVDTFNRAKSVVAGMAPVMGPMNDTFNRAKSVIGATTQAGNPFVSTFQGIWGVLQTIGTFLKTTFLPVWQQMQVVWNQQILPALKQLVAALQPLWTALQQQWAILGPLLIPVLQLLAVLLLGVVMSAIGIFAAALVGLVTILANIVTGVTMFITGIIQFVTGIVQVISGIVQFLVDLFTGKFSKLGTDLQVIWNGIQTAWNGLWLAIQGILTATVGAILSGIWAFIQSIIQFFTKLWSDLVGHSIIPDMINSILSWFNTLVTTVPNLISNMWNKVVGFFTSARDTIVGIVQGLASTVGSIIAHIQQLISGVHAPSLGSPGTPGVAPGSGPMHHFASGIENFAGGMAYVHQGEVLVNMPAGTGVAAARNVSFSPSGGGGNLYLTINAPGSTKEQINQISDALDRLWGRKYRTQFGTISGGGTI